MSRIATGPGTAGAELPKRGEVAAVEAGWLRSRAGEPDVTVVDPRSRWRYLSGHFPHAISVPAKTAFQPDGRLLSDGVLANWLGSHGIAARGTVVLYDDRDGQNAAMLAWILAYLGHPDVTVMKTDADDLRGQPTALAACYLVRCRRSDTAMSSGHPQRGGVPSDQEVVAPYRSGHIPGALSVPWLSFQGEDDLFLSPTEVVARLQELGASRDQEVLVYCGSGPRAAVAWLALHLAGAPVRLYDGGLLDWSSRPDLPLEVGVRANKTEHRSAAMAQPGGVPSEHNKDEFRRMPK